MDEIRASSTPPQDDGAGTFSGRKQEASVMDGVKKGWRFFCASSQETLRYVKAFFVGWGKKMTAKSEKEAAEADLKTAKMQVQATEAAENTKRGI
ncbi:uncharacterized protein LOC120076486 [Benincasa hispida]|uniref:uncharacterized protein LOC120076486 n=1 Tax=Benincasa hispida TaxID=102211 RepID=UPI0018FFD06F|nr:uncharacterized protein LOC120076486 [Benincasa hispida]